MASGHILLASSSAEFSALASKAIEQAGCQCLVAPTMAEALHRLGEARPQLVLVDGELAWADQGASLSQFKSHAGKADVPLILVASRESPAELVEQCFAAGVSDCILSPLDAAQLKARLDTLQTERMDRSGSRPALTLGRLPPRTVLFCDGSTPFGTAVEPLLKLNGYHLRHAAIGAVPPEVAAVDLAIVCTARPADEAAQMLSRARRDPRVERAQAVIVSGSACMPVALYGPQVIAAADASRTAPEELVQGINDALNRRAQQLHAHACHPFFCPVQFREAGGARPGPWSSCYSYAVSAGAVFLQTMAPARANSALELQVHLTTTREVLELTGVVAWSNPFQRGAAFSYPVGMAVQFLGMISKRLAQLMDLCRAAALSA